MFTISIRFSLYIQKKVKKNADFIVSFLLKKKTH